MAFFSLFGPKDPQDKDLYEYIHNIFGFYPKNIALYRVAFTHKSMSAEKVGSYHVSNERMEYLGDAVLGTAVADFLFHTYPTQPEGFLTEMRSRIVSRASLNKLSQKLGFEDYIRHAPDKSSGQGFKSIGGNAFEALMGAIYLDRGYEFAKSVIVNRIIKVHIDLDELQQTDVNYKSKLLEWSQKNKKKLEFKMLEEIGTGNKKMYHVQIVIDDKAYADALDRSIRGAEQLAAEKTSQVLFKD
jgi:ribonuclease-3